MRGMLIILILILSMGCATKGKSLQVEGYPKFTLETLKRSEYQILETTSGKGCVTRILGIIKISRPDSYYVESRKAEGAISISLFGWLFGKSSLDQAREIALYTALESVPEADFIFEPRYYDEESGFPLIYSKVCSTVKGKAVRIRPDVVKGP
jgi:hypothetical protein